MTTVKPAKLSQRNSSVEEKRNAARQKLYSNIWVDSDVLLTPVICKIIDISYTGAKLCVHGDIDLPEVFFVCTGTSKRLAKVMWKSKQEYGVEFQSPLILSAKQLRRAAPLPAPADILPPAEAASLIRREEPQDMPPMTFGAADDQREPDPLATALAQLRDCIERMKS